ncbi:unnamed protein product [Paramecium octaurelia]|uniref:Timeless N-terminal domain-containing protein n=1 Tax=Paramecium octaurelia TaxID=43137 RepID=A0A8S1XXT7_PAROT|nr:unnamed protein product [Paramecium octaurelia]
MDRDFDSESNFEERLIEDEERNDQRYYTTQLLLSIQGLGTFTKVDNMNVYAKGEKAEGALKHLCQQCKKDIPDKPIARIYLAKYRVFQLNLINLLTCYPQDKVLSYYVVILMEQLTNVDRAGIKLQTPNAPQMLDTLQEYKLYFLKPIVLQTLINHFAECIQIDQECRTKVHNDMIELIVLLFKNLLSIPDIEETKIGLESGKEVKRNLQRNFIYCMIKESVLSAFIYISQDFKSSFMQRIALPLMEIFYYALTPFDPEWILRDSEQEKELILKQAQQYRLQKQQHLSTIPTRHSRFPGLFVTKRVLSQSGQISSQPFHQHQVNKLANQRQKPQVRALISKQKTIFVKPLTIDLYDPEKEKNFKEELRHSTIDFLIHCFSKLIDQAFIEMNKEIVDSDDKVHYFVLISHFLKFIRFHCKQNKENNQGQLSSEFVSVQAALQITQFNFIYSNLINESTQLRKKNFNYRNFFAVINVLFEFLMIVRELSLSVEQTDRRNSQILLQTIVTQDIAKAISIGYGYCQFGLFNDQMLSTLVKLTALYYDLLELHTQGKAWSIRTNKLLKKKIKKQQNKANRGRKRKQDQPNEEDNDFIEKGPDEEHSMREDEEDEENEEEDDENETDDDQPIYKERRCNFVSEFAIIVDYKVLEKYFYLIKEDKLLRNSSELNIAIYKYFKRIVDTLKADWIFFQLDFLYVINSIVQNKQLTYKSEFLNLIQLFRRIGISFVQLFKVNRLMSVEILFRFPNAATKDSILKNYQDSVVEGGADVENYQQEGPKKKVIWTQKEDKILIENYEKYKDCEQPEEQLSLLLSQNGFTIKSPAEIRKRIRKFRLEEGNEKAIALYQQQYEMISMKKVEIMAKSVKSLLQEVGEESLNQFFNHLFSTLENYVDYRGQESIEMPIPPLDKLQFEFFEKGSVQAIFLGLDLKPPSQGEIYWRLQTHTFRPEINEMRSMLTKYLEKAKKIDDDQIIEEFQPLQITSQKKQLDSKKKVVENIPSYAEDELEDENEKQGSDKKVVEKKIKLDKKSKELDSEEERQIYEKYMEQQAQNEQIQREVENKSKDNYDDIFD